MLIFEAIKNFESSLKKYLTIPIKPLTLSGALSPNRGIFTF